MSLSVPGVSSDGLRDNSTLPGTCSDGQEAIHTYRVVTDDNRDRKLVIIRTAALLAQCTGSIQRKGYFHLIKVL